MFVCRACMRKSLGAIPYTRTIETRLATSLRTLPGHGLRRRAFATAVAPRDAGKPPGPDIRIYSKGLDDEAEDSPAMKRLEWVVKKHLQYLKDPKLIADHVRATLQKDKYLEALLLVRKASRNTKVTVSWNHLIDYQMKQQRLHASIKLYNEMKKRAQVPDATTYTIIFRGCAASVHPKVAVSEALRIYNSMISIGKIKPNTIHFNAVLEVCARAHDLESLFTVVKTAQEGLRSPNGQSYTIILNALRHQAWDTKNMEEADIERNKTKAMVRARGVWEGVVDRWSKGQIAIDEELVCAMGRVLATGTKEDNESIMDLLEQTMQVPHFGKLSKASALPKSDAETSAEDPTPSPLPPAARRPGYPRYAMPGNNTISLLLSSFQNTRKTTLAPKYWDYLTKARSVVPDKDNYHRYMRVLSMGRASARVAEVMPKIPDTFITPMLYRIAFTAVIHDELNPNAFRHAQIIFRDMVTRLRMPDPLAMRLFLNTARGNYARLKEQEQEQAQAAAAAATGTTSTTTNQDARVALGIQITTALDMMWGPFRVVTTQFSFPRESTRSPEHAHLLDVEKKKEMLLTARRMISAYDTVLNGAMVPPGKVATLLRARKTILVKLVERFGEKIRAVEERVEENVKGGRDPAANAEVGRKEERRLRESFMREDSVDGDGDAVGAGGWTERRAERGDGHRGGGGERGREPRPVRSVYKYRKQRDDGREGLGVRL